MIALALALLACNEGGTPDDSAVDAALCDGDGPSEVVLATSLTFARREGEVAEGFDLDGRVSDDRDEEGCNQTDLTSPDGVPGIDNAFSALMPALELTEARVIEDLIAQFVNNGELLIAVELEDVDDRVNDPCVALNVVHVLPPVSLGTDGQIVRGQTFDPDLSVPITRAEGLALVDGVVEARNLEIVLPINIFDFDVTLVMRNAAVRLRLDPDGNGGSGEMAGGVDVETLTTVVGTVASDIRDLAIDLIEGVADLSPRGDGTCAEMSTVMDFEGTNAFFYEDAP
jgi:hypothetical protein